MDALIDQILAEVTACVREVSKESLGHAEALIEAAPRVFVAGAGRSGLSIKAFGMRLMHLGIPVSVVGETTTPSINTNDLLIIASGSGQTSSLVVLAEKAIKLGVKILLFTTDSSSPLAEMAEYHILIPAPSLKGVSEVDTHISVQPMGTLFEQTLRMLCDRLILGLMQRLGIDAEKMRERHANLE